MRSIRKYICLVSISLLFLTILVGCSNKNDAMNSGLNAKIVEIDVTNQIVYVADLGTDTVFGEKCAIDCEKLVANDEIIYVDYDSEELTCIQFSDLVVGDEVIISAYDSQLNCASGGRIEVEQIQLSTQRIN